MARNSHIERHEIRPKASHRKQRTRNPPRERLQPVQERSRQRNDQILEAAAALLESVNIEDLSHSDIAAIAGISKASVHYHFPTIAAIQLELGWRYDAELTEFIKNHALHENGATWQDLVKDSANLARDWFNSHRPACEALLGPLMTRENRLAGMDYNQKVGRATARNICRRFEVGPMPHLDEVFSYNGEIIDLFWSRSYLQVGHINDAALEESMRASLGYLRNFLPDFLPLRTTPLAVPSNAEAYEGLGREAQD